jgi:hypothetical protein
MTSIATSVTAFYMPMFNPDGYEGNQRGNGNGADLNRAFPAVTGGAASQPEAVAYVVRRFVLETCHPSCIPPVAAFSYLNDVIQGVLRYRLFDKPVQFNSIQFSSVLFAYRLFRV